MVGSSSESTIGKVFENAIEIEKTAGHIYERFTNLFSGIPEVADFWKGLTKDESDHAKWLLEIKESLSEEQLLSTPDYELILKAETVKSLLNKNLTREIDNLDAAYEMAHDIESSEVNNLFKLLSGKYVSSEDRKKFLFSEINEHQQKLLDFPEKYKDRILRKEIKAEEN